MNGMITRRGALVCCCALPVACAHVDVRLGSADEEGALVGGWLRLGNGKHVLGVARYDDGVWTQIGTAISEEVAFQTMFEHGDQEKIRQEKEK